MKTKRVIFKENPHIATINESDFSADLHEDIDWEQAPGRARAYLEKHGAAAEALANPDLPPAPEEKTTEKPSAPAAVAPKVTK